MTPIEKIRSKMDVGILTKGRVVVIGAGGVGSALLPNLAVFLNAIGQDDRVKLVVVDGDAFESSNDYRVNVPAYSNKAGVWEEILASKNVNLTVRSVQSYITQENKESVIQENDLVFLCCDNHATRKLVSDRIGELENAGLVSGGNDGVTETTDGTCGNIQVYVREQGKVKHGSPLDAFHPEIANPADKNPGEKNCLEAAQQGDPQLTFANLAVASAMCNALLGLMMRPVMYDEAVFDCKENLCTPNYISVPEPE